MQEKPIISVIIPVHEINETFLQCLHSYNQSVLIPHEIIIAYDGIDGQKEYAGLEHLNIKTINLATNQGPAAARNLGASIANGTILYFGDADVSIHKDTLNKVSDKFQHNPQLDAVIGSYDDEPVHQGILSKYRNLLHHYTHTNNPGPVPSFWGACGAIKKEVFEKVGGFSDRYNKPSIEDIELGYRVSGAGYQIELDPSIKVKHHKKWKFINVIKTDLFTRAIPWVELLHEHKLFNNSSLNVNQKEKVAVLLLLSSLLSIAMIPLVSWKICLLAFLTPHVFIIGIKKPFLSFLSKHFKFFQLPITYSYYTILLGISALGFGIGTLKYQLKKK